MSVSDFVIQPETPADHKTVRALLTEAFGGSTEADLVERLRTDGDVLAAFTAVANNLLVGIVVFVRLRLEAGRRSFPAVGLAPLAVSPRWQKRGVGSKLVRFGLDALVRRGERLVFVLGDPAYYRRFAFDTVTAEAYASAYSGPHFMALALGDELPPAGRLIYPRAFAGVT